MDHTSPLSAPMMGWNRTLDDLYRSCEEEEEFYDKNRYFATVEILMYLSTYTRSDIYLATNVLAIHNQRPEARHWNGVKHLFRYLRGTKDLGLHYIKDGTLEIIGYANANFKSYEDYGKHTPATFFSRTMHQSHGSPWSRPSWPPLQTTWSWLFFTKLPRRQYVATCTIYHGAVWTRHDNKPIVIFEAMLHVSHKYALDSSKTIRVKQIYPQIFGFTHDLIQSGHIEVKNMANRLTKFFQPTPIEINTRGWGEITSWDSPFVCYIFF